MFYYGSFPLFLYKVTNVIFLPKFSFLLASRLVSSIISILTIPIIFLIGRQLSSAKTGLIASFVFAFSTGSIQYAHFNTTESSLVLFLSLITYLSIKIVKEKNVFLFPIVGLLVGLSYATKIIGLTFVIIPLISFVFINYPKLKIKKTLLWFSLFISAVVVSGFIFAPYQIIDFQHFKAEQEYMQGVTYGKYKPPFIIIYEGTLPYIFQLVKILPFTLGFVSLPLSLLGLTQIIINLIKKEKKNFLYLFIFIFPLFYFAWAGVWYAKFSRYYILLFPFLALWSAFFIQKAKKYILFFLLLLIGINGLMFLNIYKQPNTRLQASLWIYDNIPKQNKILGEHWDDNLPFSVGTYTSSSFQISQLPVYNEDNSYKISSLSEKVANSDYFITSSRRVYFSILKNPNKYPFTSKFYKLLFEGKLGFTLVKKFTNYPFIFSDDFADESFQSYDHPPVLIFKNEKKTTAKEIEFLIQ